MSQLTHVLFRADGGREIGAGHLMRCLALAQEFRQHGACVTFACQQLVPGFEDRLAAEGIDCQAIAALRGSESDARQTAGLAAGLCCDLVVIDGYRFDSRFQRTVKDLHLKTLIIDDEATLACYHADYILNQNLNAQPAMYQGRAPDATLLLGADYVLLRDEFRDARPPSRAIADHARRVLVTLGGADPLAITERLLGSIAAAADALEIVAVIGGATPRREAIRALTGAGGAKIEVREDARDMAALMAWADSGIISAGTTMWEAAYMGLPSLALVVADNQHGSAVWFERQGCGRIFDARTAVPFNAILGALGNLCGDPGARRSFAQSGMAAIDGKGRERVYRAVTGARAAGDLSLRPARLEDARLFFNWRNDPATRESSKDSGPLVWDSHLEWLKKTLNNPDRVLFTAEQDGRPVGTARADRAPGGWVLSWTVAPEARGRRIGTHMVRQVVGDLDGVIRAEIKSDNIASRRIAEAAGLRLVSEKGEMTCWETRK
ncbi:MAG: UDP-2,4-diacetamido-2,4,6-trideoxy-beta-L-altropyranose hydrolase [Sphingomonadales bacterium]